MWGRGSAEESVSGRGSGAIRCGVSGDLLTCGCLVGTYELYDGRLVTLIDEPGDRCSEIGHRRGTALRDWAPARRGTGGR